MEIIDKLEDIKTKWETLGEQLNDPEIIGDMKRFVKINKDYKDLEPIVVAFKEYKNLLANIEEAREILKNEKDEDMREMAQEELEVSEQRRDVIEEEIRLMLIPKDPTDDKNAVMEIRAGSGGDEASIFAGDLYRMYIRYCETKGWKIELVEMNEGTAGGFKEVVFNVIGDGAYGLLKFESGVHRVQRVPKTETQGRIHTSAASVVVLPEAEEIMAAREIVISETNNVRAHICHISTKTTKDMIRDAKKRGVKVTCETCPHYFTFTVDEVLNTGTNAKMNPPLREADDKLAIIEGLKDGTIDVIITDHAPHSEIEKSQEYDKCPNGILGIETMLPIIDELLS